MLAAVLYDVRIHRSLVVSGWITSRPDGALAAEPLHREEDGHYKFKYIPGFAVAMAPLRGWSFGSPGPCGSLVPLLSPQGWDHVLLLATPAVICLIDRWAYLDAGWRALVATTLVVMGLTLYDVIGRALHAEFMALSIVSVCAILVAVSLAHLRWRTLG